MTRLNQKRIHFFLCFFFIAQLCFPCSTFMLKKGKALIVGHNLDERTHVPGVVVINKSGVFKHSKS